MPDALVPEYNSSVPALKVELVHLFDKLKAMRAFVFDIDGVMTDNRILVTETGEFLRSMNVRDGFALKFAAQAGYPICIISGARSQGILHRMKVLGITQVYLGKDDKLPVFQQFLNEFRLSALEVCYMGDDILDLPILRKAGLACAPADAVPEVLEVAEYVSPLAGGQGCVRDLIEKVLKLQGKWPKSNNAS